MGMNFFVVGVKENSGKLSLSVFDDKNNTKEYAKNELSRLQREEILELEIYFAIGASSMTEALQIVKTKSENAKLLGSYQSSNHLRNEAFEALVNANPGKP